MEGRPDTQCLTVGSLFAGIGGFDLGLERAGMRTRWFVEQDPFCQRVLAKHWPNVPCYGDIRGLTAATLSPVDVLCGGFPCQDISLAGKGAGIAEGTRSGLWSEYARLIGELRPRYVIVENVSALLRRGLGRVLGDLAALGYDAEWDCIPASAVGAPHKRERVWIVAYPERGGRGAIGGCGDGRTVATWGNDPADTPTTADPGSSVAHANGEGSQGHGTEHELREGEVEGPASGFGWWLTEPDVGRVANGIPARVDRLRSLGNALVPQIAEWIGRRIVEWEASGQL